MAKLINSKSATRTTAGSDSWKADAFLNFFLATGPAGARKKLGKIPLKASRNQEKLLIAALNAKPEALERLVAKLVIEFEPVGAATDFDLDADYESNASAVAVGGVGVDEVGGYLNFLLPDEDGEYKRLGGIALMNDDVTGRMLAWLTANPSKVAVVKAKLSATYVFIGEGSKASSGFDLS